MMLSAIYYLKFLDFTSSVSFSSFISFSRAIFFYSCKVLALFISALCYLSSAFFFAIKAYLSSWTWSSWPSSTYSCLVAYVKWAPSFSICPVIYGMITSFVIGRLSATILPLSFSTSTSSSNSTLQIESWRLLSLKNFSKNTSAAELLFSEYFALLLVKDSSLKCSSFCYSSDNYSKNYVTFYFKNSAEPLSKIV